jgi:hypothetical protein
LVNVDEDHKSLEIFGTGKRFTFDHVFPLDVQQNDVFDVASRAVVDGFFFVLVIILLYFQEFWKELMERFWLMGRLLQEKHIQ